MLLSPQIVLVGIVLMHQQTTVNQVEDGIHANIAPIVPMEKRDGLNLVTLTIHMIIVIIERLIQWDRLERLTAPLCGQPGSNKVVVGNGTYEVCYPERSQILEIPYWTKNSTRINHCFKK